MGKILNSPIVGVVMCSHTFDEDGCLQQAQLTQWVQQKYLDAVAAAGGLPVALPHQLASYLRPAGLSLPLDGIMLPGSHSNLQPHLYGESGDEPLSDPGRDTLSLQLVHLALNHHIPLLGICRGMQEMVVATGGTLHRHLNQLPELLEHRENGELALDQQYDASHEVIVQAGGVLSTLIPDPHRFWVNSLHNQGIKTLGPDIRIEALAPDGLIEAISVRDQPFAVGVQWHPEWLSEQHVLSQRLFAAFINACRRYQAEKEHK